MRLVACTVALGLGLACGGMSLDHGGGGTGGTAGGAGGTTGGAGGTTGGAGGTTGGAGGTTGGAGGTIIVNPVGGSAGAPSICSLPLETGNCDAAITRYGFDTAQNQCVKFFYGGCGGNKNNFATADDCKASCPTHGPVGCPTTLAQATATPSCSAGDCLYSGFDGCLCQDFVSPCTQADPSCTGAWPQDVPIDTDAGACSNPDCSAPIVLPSDWRCRCTSGSWACARVN